MKSSILILTILVFLSTNCKRHSILSLNSTKQNQIIAFVPLDNYNPLEINSVINEVSHFYNKQAIILNSVNIPERFYHAGIKQYSADSLISLLSKFRNDSIIEIIGLTHKPIYTIIEVKPMPYFNEYVFGMALQPGNACIISDYKFRTTDIKVFNHRLKNVIIHEVGHNLGLSHCPDNKCIMAKKWEYQTLDNRENDYCIKCRNRLYH